MGVSVYTKLLADPWNRKWQPAPIFLPGKSREQKSLKGYSPWSRSDTAVYVSLEREPGSRLSLHPCFLAAPPCLYIPSLPLLEPAVWNSGKALEAEWSLFPANKKTSDAERLLHPGPCLVSGALFRSSCSIKQPHTTCWEPLRLHYLQLDLCLNQEQPS